MKPCGTPVRVAAPVVLGVSKGSSCLHLQGLTVQAILL
jgi:hypothetical protein